MIGDLPILPGLYCMHARWASAGDRDDDKDSDERWREDIGVTDEIDRMVDNIEDRNAEQRDKSVTVPPALSV